MDPDRYEAALKKCWLRLESAHNLTLVSAQKGIAGKAAAAHSACGRILARFDVCQNWNPVSGVTLISWL